MTGNAKHRTYNYNFQQKYAEVEPHHGCAHGIRYGTSRIRQFCVDCKLSIVLAWQERDITKLVEMSTRLKANVCVCAYQRVSRSYTVCAITVLPYLHETVTP